VSPILSTFSLGAKPSTPKLTVQYIASAFSTTHQITVPATAAANDIVIISWTGRTTWNSAPATADPSGWTLIGDNFSSDVVNSNDVEIRWWYKKIVSGDVNSVITVANSGWTTDVNSIIVFRPSASATPTVQSVADQATSGNPTLQTQDGTLYPTPHVTIAHYHASGAIDPRTESSGTFTELNSGTTNYLKYRIFNKDSDRISVNFDMDDEGWGSLNSGIISFARG
jgi:hypothetical protein